MLEEISYFSYFGKFLKVGLLHNQFCAKEVTLVTFSSPELAFSRNSADSAFSFWLYSSERKCRIHVRFGSIAQKENAEFTEIFRFSINSCNFDRS